MKIQEINVYTAVLWNGLVLCMKMPNGLWEFPGGSVDWGELPEKAAVRETKEESGLDVSDIRFLTITSATYKKNDDDKHSVYIVYTANSSSDKVTVSHEHVEYRWLKPSELRFLKWALNAEPVVEMLEK